MSRTHELQFLLEAARGQGTADDRRRWASLVEVNGEERALMRLSQWLSSGPTWDDDPDDEDHPDPMLLARAAEDPEHLFERPELLAHLGRCDECLEAFDAAIVERLAAHDRPERSTTSVLRWIAAAASVLFLVGFLFLRDRGPEGVAHLAQLEPLAVRTLRSEADASPLSRGLERYSVGEFDEAAEELARALDREPERTEARVYLGSTLLLLGRTADALAVLDGPGAAEATGEARDEILWLRAQAHLLLEDRERALAALEARSAGARRHLADAALQLEALREPEE